VSSRGERDCGDQRVMVRTSVAKCPDIEDICNVMWFHLSIWMHTNCEILAVDFCISLI
jgi:hypothetical protein